MTILGDPNRVPESRCLNCGRLNDACSGVGENCKPRPGNISICIQCAWISVFNKDLSLRQPNAEEIAECMSDPRVLLAVGAVVARNKENGVDFPFKGTKQ